MITRRVPYKIGSEPSGITYRNLIDFSAHVCIASVLVVRPSLELSERGHALLKRLEPFLISKEERSSWPGTTLLCGRRATVYRHMLSAPVVAILRDTAGGLFDWQQPSLPEDLCLIRSDGSPWLISIAHERYGELLLSDTEKAELLVALGSMRLTPVPHARERG